MSSKFAPKFTKTTSTRMDKGMLLTMLPDEILFELMANKGGNVVVERNRKTGEITFSVER